MECLSLLVCNGLRIKIKSLFNKFKILILSVYKIKIMLDLSLIVISIMGSIRRHVKFVKELAIVMQDVITNILSPTIIVAIMVEIPRDQGQRILLQNPKCTCLRCNTLYLHLDMFILRPYKHTIQIIKLLHKQVSFLIYHNFPPSTNTTIISTIISYINLFSYLTEISH